MLLYTPAYSSILPRPTCPDLDQSVMLDEDGAQREVAMDNVLFVQVAGGWGRGWGIRKGGTKKHPCVCVCVW